MPLKHLVTSKEALEFIHASIHSAISSTLYSIVKRPLYSATLYFIFLLCYSSPTFRATLYHILVLIGIWNLFLSDGGVVVKAKQLGKLVREPSRYLLPHSAFIAKPTVTESKSTSMKLQVVIPLAPSTEKPLMEVVSAFSKTTLTPIVNIITQGDDDAKVLEVIEFAIISAITEIGRKSSNIDFTALVSLKLVPKITQHIKDCRLAAIKASKITSNNSKIQSAGSETIDEALLVQCYKDGELHSALKSWTAEGPEKLSHKLSEIEYLKGIVRQLLPKLFENDTKSSIFSTLMTELLADQVLKAGIDILSDSDYWNQIFDTLGDHVMSQEHVLAKRISEAVEKQINEEDVEREDKQPVPQSLLDSGIAAMISNGNIEDILDEIKSCTILKDAMKMKECIQNEIMADKARMESLAKGNYGELIQVKDIKHRIKLYHKAVKRVKRRIRVLKRQKNGGSNQEKSNVPPLEEILKSGQLRSFFQEFDSLLPRTNSVRPHYYQLWTKLSDIEAQTGLMISEGNPAEHRHVLESQSSRLSTATVLQDSYFDLADFYDTEDISVSPVIMDSIKTFLETEVNSRFWSIAGTHIQESENLKDDLQTLHEKILNALNTIGTSNQPLVLLNDLEPLWKLRHSIIEELESVEYCSFLKSSQCEDMMSCIAEDLDDGNCETIENQADSNSGPLQIRRWSKLPSKKLFAALHWMKAKDKDLMADATEVNDDEYIRSYIIPLKETSDDDGSDDELPVRWKTFADRRIKSPELRAKMKKRKSFDIFGMQQQSRGLLPTTEEVDCSDESDEEKTIGLMKKLKKKALEELSSLSCWKSKKQQPDEPKSANNSMTRSSSMRSPKQTMSPRSEPLKTDESTQSLGRKRVSSASIETITKPKPFHRLQSQSLEEFPKPGTQSNKEKFTLEPFRFLKSRRQSPSRTGSTDALSASPPGSMHSSAKTLKESPTNSNSLVSVLRRKSHQSPTRTSTQTSDTLSDKNPFIQGSNRRSTLIQGSDLIKSAAKGILQRVANGAETIKSFRPNLGRKKINSDAEAESSGNESCNDNALDRTWSESYETVLEEMEVSEDGPFVDSATLEKKGVTQADILLPALSTPRIIELDEVMENTRSELEDVQEHLANSAQLDLSASRIRALNLMKAGLEVELKRLETEKAACKDRDIQNLISPKSTSVIIRCDEDGRDLTHFTVEVHLTNAEGLQSGWIVHRKFSEFITLHQTLKSHFPVVNQYEAPQNKIFKGVLKFRKRFMENRRKLLETYLQNLLKHVDICKSIEFRKFICHTDIIRLLYNDTVSTHDSKAENKKKKQFVKNLFHKFEENIKRHTKPQSRFNSVSLNAEEVAALKSRPENNTDTVDLLFDLITEIFELKEKGNFIRRKALNLVLQHILGGAIERRVTDSLKSVFCEEFMVSRIEYLKTSLFDTVWPIRTPEQKAKCRQTSSSKMIHLSLALLGKVVGKKNARRGALKFLWVFQNSILNRQLIYMLLDDIIEALFGK